jgi:hypothetical protein
MHLRILVEDMRNGDQWIEEYDMMNNDDPLKWAEDAIQIWNRNRSKMAHEHRVVMVRTLYVNPTKGKRIGEVPWETGPKLIRQIVRTK